MATNLSNRKAKTSLEEQEVSLSARLGQRKITVPPVGGSPASTQVEINDPTGSTDPNNPIPAPDGSQPATPAPAGGRRDQIINDLHALQQAINVVSNSVYGVDLPTEDLIDVATKTVDALGDCVADNTTETVSNILGSPPKRHGISLSNRAAQADLKGDLSSFSVKFTELSRKGQELKAKIQQAVRGLPGNPKVTPIGDSAQAGIVNSADLGSNWSPQHHLWKRQYELVAKAIEKAELSRIPEVLKEIIEDERVGGQSLADGVVENLKKMLGMTETREARKLSAAVPEQVMLHWLEVAKSLARAGIPAELATQDARRVAEQNNHQRGISPEDWNEMWQGITGELGSNEMMEGGVGLADQEAEQGGVAAPTKPKRLNAPPAEMGDEKYLIPQGQIDAEPEISADWIIDEYEKAKKIKDETKRKQRIDRLRQIAQGYKDLSENPRLGRLK